MEIELVGLFLLVRNNVSGTVHVLAPIPQDEHSEQLDVRLLHHSFGDPKGRSLAGWALVLGTGSVPADTTLQTDKPAQGEVVDLSALTGKKVPRTLHGDSGSPEIAARITLRAGRAIRATGRAKWHLNGREIVLAETLTWRIDDVPDELEWISIGATGLSPVHSLRELAPRDGGLIRLRIIHLPQNAPSQKGAAAAQEDVSRYFQAFYRLLGKENSDDERMPRLVGKATGAMMPILAIGDDDTDDW